MSTTYMQFELELLKQTHKEVKQRFPHVHLWKDAWVYDHGRDHWEFHGPDKFYWHGRANSAYEARANGWNAYLNKLDRENKEQSNES